MNAKKVIAIMRPASYLAESVKLANAMGFDAITAPMIDVVDIADGQFKKFLQRIMEGEADYVVFTSANGVEFTFLKLIDHDEFVEQLNKIHIVAIGPKTKNALIKNGIRVSIVPESYSSEGLVEQLEGIEGAAVEIVRSSHGSPVLVEGLRKKGAIVHETQVYEIICPRDERHVKLIEKTLKGKVDIFAFTSSMMVRNFIALAEEMGARDEIIKMMNEKIVAAIGKPTSDMLAEFGVEVKVMPERYTFEELLKECRKKDC